jgi:hypothetical protein
MDYGFLFLFCEIDNKQGNKNLNYYEKEYKLDWLN